MWLRDGTGMHDVMYLFPGRWGPGAADRASQQAKRLPLSAVSRPAVQLTKFYRPSRTRRQKRAPSPKDTWRRRFSSRKSHGMVKRSIMAITETVHLRSCHWLAFDQIPILPNCRCSSLARSRQRCLPLSTSRMATESSSLLVVCWVSNSPSLPSSTSLPSRACPLLCLLHCKTSMARGTGRGPGPVPASGSWLSLFMLLLIFRTSGR